MSSCEKCWNDAGEVVREYGGNKAKRYAELMEERKATPCTPEEQAGPEATVCPKCARRTVHQVTGECMVCHFDAEQALKDATPDLYEALDRLTGEVRACWRTEEGELRHILGNTNYQVVEERIAASVAALAKARGEEG